MAMQPHLRTGSDQFSDLEQNIQKLRELYADAPEIGKAALENVIRALQSRAPAKNPAVRIESAGRIGRREGKVSELTLEEGERAHILATLKKTRWVLAGPRGAAKRLGIKRSTLQFRMKKLGIERPTEYGEASHWGRL